MKRNRIFAWVLAAALTLSLTVAPALAAYPDVTENWSWAAEAIDDMTEKGLFVGFKDGTFQPAKQLTTEQALILSARISADLDLRQKIGLARREEVKGLLGDGKSWWWDEAATCLEAGIISHDELRALSQAGVLDKAIIMEDFSVYIIRAMQLEHVARNLTTYNATFSDAASITPSRQPYAYLLEVYGLVQGDEHKNFNPKSNVNRARAATLISRVLDFMEKSGTSVELPEYTDYDWKAGTIANVTTGDKGVIILSLENEGMDTQVVSCLPNIKIYKDNMLTDTSSLKTGVYARVNLDEKDEPASIRLSGGLETVSGGISSITGKQVSVNAAGVVRSFDISRFTQVQTGSSVGDRTLIDPEAGYTSAVCKVDDLGDLVYLQLLGGTRVETGLISGVETVTAGGYKLMVTAFNGSSQQFVVPASAVITVNSVNTNTINASYLNYYVSLRVSNQSGEALSVVIDTVATYRQGAVKGTSYQNSTNTITIGDPTSSNSGTYNMSPEAVITYDDKPAVFKDIQKDWYVTARISGGEVVLLAAYPGSSVTTGTVSKPLEFSSGVVTMSVLQDNGVVATFPMDLNELPSVKRDGSNSSIDKIKSGDSVTVTVRYNRVTQIDCIPQNANVTGTITEKSEVLRGGVIEVTLTIQLSDGTTDTYVLTSDGVTVTMDGKIVDLTDLKTGYRVSMVVNAGTVSSIEVEKTSASTTELNGKVLLVNTTDKTILFQTTNGNTVMVSVPVGTKIMEVQGTTTKDLSLRSLESDDVLQITGAYEGLNFKAALIIRK